ncbi:MAG: RluA family pseudouridine synthase [Thermoanaerobaculia bacterium]
MNGFEDDDFPDSDLEGLEGPGDTLETRPGAPDRWKVSAKAAGQRLDVYLAKVYKTTRSQVARWIQEGRVVLADRRAKAGIKLDGGEWISCDPRSPSQEGRVEPEDGELTILHEDEHLVVLDKPARIAVHPGAGRPDGTIANRLLARYPETGAVGGPGRPGIVHRLDLGTSGVMVVARTATAHLALANAFAERRVKKTYLAIGYGAPADAEGTVVAPIARHAQRRKEMTVLLSGRPAETKYRVLGTENGISVFELTPVTGRTHQIRVHLKHIGHPIVGDPVYGEARWKGLAKASHRILRDFDRPALHARRLELDHPETGESCSFEAPVPEDMKGLWREVAGREWPEEV